MNGTRFSIESKFFLKPNPDFIIKGILRKVISDIMGNKFADMPIIIIKYDTIGKIQKSFAAFSFPPTITKDFVPLELLES